MLRWRVGLVAGMVGIGKGGVKRRGGRDAPRPGYSLRLTDERTSPRTRCGAGIHTSTRLTGESRYPRWGPGGGIPSAMDGLDVGVCPPGPTMGPRIGVWGDEEEGGHLDSGLVSDHRLTGESRYPRTPMRGRYQRCLVLPAKERHPARRCGAGIHGWARRWARRRFAATN